MVCWIVRECSNIGLESIIALTNPVVVNVADTLSLCRALDYGEGVDAECLHLALLPYFVGMERGSESPAFLTQSSSGSMRRDTKMSKEATLVR